MTETENIVEQATPYVNTAHADLSGVRFSVPEGRESCLSEWKARAKEQIKRWLIEDRYEEWITANTLKEEFLGPFTKFLYWFGGSCKCGWGVMIDFSDHKQRVFLPNHYYNWMHKLRDEVIAELEAEGYER